MLWVTTGLPLSLQLRSAGPAGWDGNVVHRLRDGKEVDRIKNTNKDLTSEDPDWTTD